MSVNNQNLDIVTKVLNLVSRQFDLNCNINDIEKKFDDFKADYLDKIEIVMHLEDEFGIQITDDEVDQVTSINDLIQVVVGKK